MFCDYFNARRLELGLSRDDIALEVPNLKTGLPITYQAVAEWDVGKSVPSEDKYPYIAALFGTTEEEIREEMRKDWDEKVAKGHRRQTTDPRLIVLESRLARAKDLLEKAKAAVKKAEEAVENYKQTLKS